MEWVDENISSHMKTNATCVRSHGAAVDLTIMFCCMSPKHEQSSETLSK